MIQIRAPLPRKKPRNHAISGLLCAFKAKDPTSARTFPGMREGHSILSEGSRFHTSIPRHEREPQPPEPSIPFRQGHLRMIRQTRTRRSVRIPEDAARGGRENGISFQFLNNYIDGSDIVYFSIQSAVPSQIPETAHAESSAAQTARKHRINQSR